MMLVEKMNHSIASLSELKHIIIRENGFKIPTGGLRDPEPSKALEALRETPFFTPGGPRREEIIFMADLLRKDDYGEAEIKPGEDAVVKLLTQANTGKIKKIAWEITVTQLVVDGAIRRGHLMPLISAEALRRVGFKAQELLDAAFKV